VSKRRVSMQVAAILNKKSGRKASRSHFEVILKVGRAGVSLRIELPTTRAADDSAAGVKVKMTFERHIVWPDGRKEIEGVTPKLITDASHALPNVSPPLGSDVGKDMGTDGYRRKQLATH
jgi:hypothetical protein